MICKRYMKKMILVLSVFLFSFILQSAEGQTFDEDVFPITKSIHMKEIVFDGKWSFTQEWKQSSAKLIQEGDSRIHLRAAHFEDFLYVLVDFETDHTLDKNSDKATICFDTKNEKNIIPDENDYCFSVVLGRNLGTISQGGSEFVMKSNYKKIENVDGFIAIAKASDENDRYSKYPHSTFEFRIPINLIGRSDNYGFLMSVYESSSGKFYTWPENLREHVLFVPSPSIWGNLVSPDKSLPEFELPLLAILPAFVAIVLISRFKINKIQRVYR